MRQEQTVNLGSLEFFHNLQAVVFIVEEAFLVDVVNVYKIHAQLPQAVGGEITVFDSVRRRENAAPRRGVAILILLIFFSPCKK